MRKQLLALSTLFFFSTLLLSSQLSEKTSEVSLVVYDSNIAIVHEEKTLSLYKGDSTILYKDVPSSINSDSINLTLPSGIQLQSQQFKYDKLTQAKLLEAHIGKEVDVRRLKSAYEHEIIKATLLAYNHNNAIVRTIGHQILTVDISSLIFESVPKELITQPSLLWKVITPKDITGELKLDYLVNNITYTSDYILHFDANSSKLIGWITIDNRSGKNYQNTKLSVLSGDINRAKQDTKHYKQVRAMTMMDNTPTISNYTHEDYHLYTIPFKVSLANNEKTQIPFINQKKIPSKKEYIAHLNNPLYLNGESISSVMQQISLDSLKVALPKGIVRTYSQFKDKTILLGETKIKHTPKGTEIKLQIGKSFDLKVRQTVLSRQDNENLLSSDIEYKVTNNSNEAKTITLLIPFNKQSSSKVQTEMNYSYTKGNFVTFTLLVAPNATEKFDVHFESKK